MKPENKRPIAIGDLLRLKRAERPATEFWAGFDQKLRAKQLAALVEKRPWWQSLPSPFAVLSRHRVPFGAAAAFALTVLIVRKHRAPASQVPLNVSPQGSAVAANQSATVTPIEASAAVVALNLPTSGSVAVSETTFIEAVKVIPSAVARLDAMPATLTSVAAVLTTEAPAARYVSVALNSASMGTDVVNSNRLLAASTGFEARALPAPRAVVDPLQQMTPPGESRRASRLLTAMVSPAALQTSTRVTERAASRIAEDSLYDQVSRFGARGNQLNVKF